MSPPNDNVLLVPDRNVLLTRAGWEVGNGPTPDDAEGARPTGRAEEAKKKLIIQKEAAVAMDEATSTIYLENSIWVDWG
jgi:hypothetical protein